MIPPAYEPLAAPRLRAEGVTLRYDQRVVSTGRRWTSPTVSSR